MVTAIYYTNEGQDVFLAGRVAPCPYLPSLPTWKGSLILYRERKFQYDPNNVFSISAKAWRKARENGAKAAVYYYAGGAGALLYVKHSVLDRFDNGGSVIEVPSEFCHVCYGEAPIPIPPATVKLLAQDKSVLQGNHRGTQIQGNPFANHNGLVRSASCICSICETKSKFDKLPPEQAVQWFEIFQREHRHDGNVGVFKGEFAQPYEIYRLEKI